MADLVSARFGQLNPWWNLMGQPVNATQADIPARSNLEYLGIGSGSVDTAAALTTDTMTIVPVPVDAGTVISNLIVLAGNTAASTPLHQTAALYSGLNSAAPAKLAVGTDATTTTIATNAVLKLAFGTPYTVQPADVPNGYLWAGITIKATTVPSLVTTNVAFATSNINYAWTTNFLGGSSTGVLNFVSRFGSSLAGVPPATITSVTAQANPPIVILT